MEVVEKQREAGGCRVGLGVSQSVEVWARVRAWSCGQPRWSLESGVPAVGGSLEKEHRGSPKKVTTRVKVTCGGLLELLRSTKLLGHKGLRVQSDPLVFEGVFLCLFVWKLWRRVRK